MNIFNTNRIYITIEFDTIFQEGSNLNSEDSNLNHAV